MKAILKNSLSIFFENEQEKDEAKKLASSYLKQGFSIMNDKTIEADKFYLLESSETFTHKILK